MGRDRGWRKQQAERVRRKKQKQRKYDKKRRKQGEPYALQGQR